jgi:hypothetical protein
MPTWLAIAIPSVIAVAACLMWALDYSKKAHEIEKLRLEVERLRREREKTEKEDGSRAAGLYTPTAQEIDWFTSPTDYGHGVRIGKHRETNARRARRRVGSRGLMPKVGWREMSFAVVVVIFLLYGLTSVVFDLVRWLSGHQ